MDRSHTELPWRIGEISRVNEHGGAKEFPFEVWAGDELLLSLCGPRGRANAEFIVRSCNEHEALVNALAELQHDLVVRRIMERDQRAVDDQRAREHGD